MLDNGGKMLTDTKALQHSLYGDWKRDNGSRYPAPFCKFCRVGNRSPHKEYHMPDCARLEYLIHFYNVKPRKPKDKKYRNVIVDGSEFMRSGVYGWWCTMDEFNSLGEQIHPSLDTA